MRTATLSFLQVPGASTGPDLEAGAAQDVFAVGAVLLVFLTQLPHAGKLRFPSPTSPPPTVGQRP